MVMSGGIYVPPMNLGDERMASDIFQDTSPGALRALPVAADGHDGAASLDSLGLTPRQTEVLHLLLQGKPNKLIARDLKLSVETIKDHVAAVLRSLGVSSRTQAVLAISEMMRPGGSASRRGKTGP